MGELTPELENLLDSQRVGVLATIRRRQAA
jgi:hypothetical protein